MVKRHWGMEHIDTYEKRQSPVGVVGILRNMLMLLVRDC